MGFVESNLLNGEELIYQARLHPIVYSPAIVLALFSLIWVLGTFSGQDAVGFVGVGFVGLVFAGILALGAYINITTSEFAVTSRRVLIKVGWVRRSSLELLLQKVEGIAVDQGIIGRMFDFGTIGVRGTGGTREKFQNISAPLEFRRQVQALIPR